MLSSGSVPWRRDKIITKIRLFLISPNPNRKIGIHIIEPCFEDFRVCCVTKQSCGDNSAACCIMPAVSAVRIWNTAGHISVPVEIGSILSERSAETDGSGGIPPWIGAAIKIMKATTVGMGNHIVWRKKHIFRMGREDLHHGLSGLPQGFLCMAKGSERRPRQFSN